MSTVVTPIPEKQHKPFSRAQSILLVFCCTILGAAAQMVMKYGLNQPHTGWIGWVTNLPLLAGYCLYGINTVLLVFALRDGELSILYPIIALTYVWVTFLSVWLFHETVNVYKGVGVAIVVTGVAVLGKGSRS